MYPAQSENSRIGRTSFLCLSKKKDDVLRSAGGLYFILSFAAAAQIGISQARDVWAREECRVMDHAFTLSDQVK